MKPTKSIILIAFLTIALALNGHSQSFWEWSDPTPLTDSLSDNARPFLYLYNYYDALFMVWEKPIDSLTTAIYMDNILNVDPAEEVIYTPGVKYSHPKIMYADYYSGSDTALFLLYESNQNGNSDIYCKPYLKSGGFTASVPLTNSPDDEDQFTIGRSDIFWGDAINNQDLLAYIRNDSLFVRNLVAESGSLFFDVEIPIDGPNCMDPSGGGAWGTFALTYLKADSGEYHIYLSNGDNNGNWSSPEIIYDSNDCRNITRALHYGDLVWSAYQDSSWWIKAKNDWLGVSTYPISKETPFDPAALGLILGVKSWFPDIWTATPFPDADTVEIYMTIGPGWPDFENFTVSGNQNRNPQFFTGEAANSHCFFDYLVWESYYNGHWQIWCSKVIQCAGSISEEEMANAFISAHPNPFANETNIEFTLDKRSDVAIEIYNSRGMQIHTIASRTYDQGTHQLRWNTEGLAAGIYIVKVNVGDKIYTSKVIKSH